MFRIFYLPLTLSVTILLGGFYLTNVLPFNTLVPIYIQVGFVLDVMFTLFAISIFSYFNSGFVKRYTTFFTYDCKLFFEETYWFWVLLLVCALVLLLPRLNMISNGISREDIVTLGRSRFMMIITPIALIVTASVLSFGGSFRVKVVFISLFFISMIYSLSRSEILNLIYFLVVLISFNEVKNRNLKKVGIYFLILACLSAFITIYQGRSQNFERATFNMLEALFKYTAFSMYLSDVVINKLSMDFEKIFFPFFGFISERFLSIFAELNNPIGVDNSEFVSKFHSLGSTNALSGNVVYPWWPWFYTIYGWFGLVLKFLYVTFLLFFINKLKLHFTMIYFVFILFFLQYKKHPLLNNDSVYFLLSILALDIAIKVWIHYRREN